MENYANTLTPAQRKKQALRELQQKARNIERTGIDFFNMEMHVPYLFRLENFEKHTTKLGETAEVARVLEVTTGETGCFWLGQEAKTRIKNVFNEWRTKKPAKGEVILLELTDKGLEDADLKKGEKARSFDVAFHTYLKSDLESMLNNR